MKPSVSFLIGFLFFELLSIATINVSFSHGSASNVGCIETERKALLMFKQDLNDTSNRLASWIGSDGDCCNWAGVVCGSITGHVLELHLGNPHTEYFTSDVSESTNERDAEIDAFVRSRLGGKLNPSLLDLKHLNYLDLNYNYFEGIWIPRFLGSMESLTYLNLSHAGFSGMIPHQFGNLSNLQYLDLSYNSLSAENLFWLSSLPLLEHLDLSAVNLSNASDWLLEINTLPSLKVLKLAYCELQHFPPLSIVNFSSLVTLDLSNNRAPLIPSWVLGLSHLHFLDISYNEIQGPIPTWLMKFKVLFLEQTFDPTCFMGNELCGSSLPKNGNSPTPGRNENDRGKYDGEHEVVWFYVSMTLGFVVGFWSLIGPLIVNRRWRYMYCRFLDRLGDIIGSIVRKCF